LRRESVEDNVLGRIVKETLDLIEKEMYNASRVRATQEMQPCEKWSLLVVHTLLESNKTLAKPILLHTRDLLEMVQSLRATDTSSESRVSQGVQRLDRHATSSSLCVREALESSERWKTASNTWEAHGSDLVSGAIKLLIQDARTIGVGADGHDASSCRALDHAAIRRWVPLTISLEVRSIAGIDGAWESASLKIWPRCPR
jgi:hypothetical protein